jgi:protein O-GlcNAc transferase
MTPSECGAGVPVLTLPGGKPHASRVAASVVMSLGLGELVARTLQDYEDVAVRIISKPTTFAAVKNKLVATRRGHRLFDRRWWARLVEVSYAMMWDAFAAGYGNMHVVVADR